MRIGIFLAATALVTGVSCSRDVNETKTKYVQIGNKYFAAGKYRQASILYRSALRKDAKFAEAYYRLALAELQLGRTTDAVAPLRRAAELLPAGTERNDAQSRLADIYLFYLEGIPKDTNISAESQRLAGDLVKSGRGAYDGHRLNGRLAMLEVRNAARRGNPDQVKEYLTISIKEFREADAIKPFQSGVLIPLARSLVSAKQSKEAERVYLALLNHDNSFLPVYGELYNLYVSERRLDDAENILKSGLASHPREVLLITNLASHYHGVHREDEALKMIERLKTAGLGMPHLNQITGAFYKKLGNPDEAIRQYEAGIRTEPGEENYYRKRIAETLISQRKMVDARRLVESVLQHDPKDAEARLLYGSIFLQAGEFNSAAKELQAAVQSDLLNPVARYSLGSALAGQGQLALALTELQKAVQLDPNYLDARLKLAQLQILVDQNEGALKTTQNIFEDLDQRNVQAKLLRSVALRNLNRLDEARVEIQSALKLQPNSPDALLQLGELRLSEEKYKEAEQAFRKCYEQDPRDTRGLLRIAEMYLARNERAHAIQTLQAESARQPGRLDLRRALADVSARAHSYPAAIAEYQIILAKLDPTTTLASEIYGELGEAYRASGQYDLALNALQKAREGLPKDPAVLSNLAVTLLRLGRIPEAKQFYESTFTTQAENPIALNNLAFLMAEKNGDLDTALTFAQRARQKWPHVDEISDTVAWIYLKKNLNENAIEILEVLVNKRPDQPTFRYHLGAALLQRGEKVKARIELETALGNRPSPEEVKKIRELLAQTSS
jgi:tetratricopeptide (TPR) repeat protein